MLNYDINPDQKYLLPMPGTLNREGRTVAFARYIADKDIWVVNVQKTYFRKGIIKYCSVKGSDILNGPDWVRVLRPEAIDD